MQISHLFAGKPQAFGSRGAPSSIIKRPFSSLQVKYQGATQDEQGNKKLHGGPYMALHQYAQGSYDVLKQHFSSPKINFEIGTIGENISAPNMHEHNVYIGDEFKVGSAIIKVVSPRAPCSKINYRYGINKMDRFIAQHNITGWYYKVSQEGDISLGDNFELIGQDSHPLSVAQIWQLRQTISTQASDIEHWLAIAKIAINTLSLSPEWQAHVNRAAVKLDKLL